MPVEDARVRVVENCRLHAAAQQCLGLPHEELVEGVLARDEHRQTRLAPPGAAPLLAQACHGARKADREGTVEQADIDAELEGVRGRDAQQVACEQPPLDLPALGGRVPGAVRGKSLGERPVEPVAREAVDELRGLAALREADRAQASLDQRREET